MMLTLGTSVAAADEAAVAAPDTFQKPYGSCRGHLGVANVGVNPNVTTVSNGGDVSPTVCAYESSTSGTEITPGVAAYGYTAGAPGAIAGGGVTVCHEGGPLSECAQAGGGGVAATTAPTGGSASIVSAGAIPSACVGYKCFAVFAFATMWGPTHRDAGVFVFAAICEQYWLGLNCPVMEGRKINVPPTPAMAD
jgi:hypothetical protein